MFSTEYILICCYCRFWC